MDLRARLTQRAVPLLHRGDAAGPDGDHNENGTVDAADYVTWRNDPGSFGGDQEGFDVWRANFGKTGPYS